jgi:hypothetical protein
MALVAFEQVPEGGLHVVTGESGVRDDIADSTPTTE